MHDSHKQIILKTTPSITSRQSYNDFNSESDPDSDNDTDIEIEHYSDTDSANSTHSYSDTSYDVPPMFHDGSYNNPHDEEASFNSYSDYVTDAYDSDYNPIRKKRSKTPPIINACAYKSDYIPSSDEDSVNTSSDYVTDAYDSDYNPIRRKQTKSPPIINTEHDSTSDDDDDSLQSYSEYTDRDEDFIPEENSNNEIIIESHHHIRESAISTDWILLDSCSTVNVFCNPLLLTNLHKVKATMYVHC